LRPFSVHQSRRAVRRRCQLHGPSRFDVSPAWAPTLRPVRPCGFSLPRVSFPFFACVETPPARVIRGRCLSPTYRARDPGCYRDLAGRLTARRRSWDLSFPSQCSSDLRAVTPHRHDRAHLPFPRIHPPRVSSSREPTLVERGSWVARPRLLGFASLPQVSRAVSSADPAMAFMHRVVRTHRPGLPWDFNVLSQVFGVAPPASTSEGHSTRASRAATRDIAAAMNVAERRPCPSALSGAVA
jgi:hypothetical protein